MAFETTIPPSVHSGLSIFSPAQMNYNELRPPRARFVYFINDFHVVVMPSALVSCCRVCAAERALLST